jgi:uncharacterized membrane protein YqjE
MVVVVFTPTEQVEAHSALLVIPEAMESKQLTMVVAVVLALALMGLMALMVLVVLVALGYQLL